MTDSDYEEPLADVVEQNQPAAPTADESDEPRIPRKIPLEVDAADAAEQAREVELDEDDYR
jgi:hypothetical protein